MHEFDILDNHILNILQEDFPVDSRPFLIMAEKLHVSEKEILDRIQKLRNYGIIRRIGGIIDSGKLGFYSTLCACQVPEDRIEEVAAIINCQKEVTHNYIRDHELNMWFTLTVASPDKLLSVIRNLENLTGLNIQSMPATKLYKIKVSLQMGKENGL